MRRVVLVVSFTLAGCGAFLGFGEDDVTEPPSSSDGSTAEGQGPADAAGETSVLPADSAVDAAEALYTWTCKTLASASVPYASSDACEQARLQDTCNPVAEAPLEGDPCDSASEATAYCPTVCMKTGTGTVTYSYPKTECSCVRQP